VRLRHRLGLDAALDGVVAALEPRRLLGPHPFHDRELLFEAGAALLEVDAVEGELVRLVPDGDAAREAAPGHHVEHGHFFGQTHRVVERGHEDVGAQHHARRPCREAREHGQRRRPVVIRDRVVLLHPRRVEAELLGARDFLQRLSVVVAAFAGNEADLQSGHGGSSRSIMPARYYRIRRHAGARDVLDSRRRGD